MRRNPFFVSGLREGANKSLLGALCLVMAPTAILVMNASAPSQADSLTDEKSVYRDCEVKGLQFWDCDCVVQEFRAAKAAKPDEPWFNLMGDIYNNSCFDATKIEKQYEKKCPNENKIDAIMAKKPPTDCACYGKSMAERIVGRELKVLSFSGLAKISREVRDQCR